MENITGITITKNQNSKRIIDIKINDEMSSFMKQVLESANMTNEGKWPIHQLQKVTTCLDSRTKFD